MMTLGFAAQNVNSETRTFVLWLIASEFVDVDRMIDQADERAAILSSRQDGSTERSVRDELARLVKALVIAAVEKVDPYVQTVYRWPVTETDLWRKFVLESYLRIDCRAAAEELLVLAGRAGRGGRMVIEPPIDEAVT
jgi:hypothetical protein